MIDWKGSPLFRWRRKPTYTECLPGGRCGTSQIYHDLHMLIVVTIVIVSAELLRLYARNLTTVHNYPRSEALHIMNVREEALT